MDGRPGNYLSQRALTYPFSDRFRRHLPPRFPTMRYDSAITDRQIGRNAELFAQSIAELDDREERYPYLRILISLVDQAHPEWRQAPNKVERIAELAVRLSEGALDPDEVQEVVRVRDKEKGYHS